MSKKNTRVKEVDTSKWYVLTMIAVAVVASVIVLLTRTSYKSNSCYEYTDSWTFDTAYAKINYVMDGGDMEYTLADKTAQEITWHKQRSLESFKNYYSKSVECSVFSQALLEIRMNQEQNIVRELTKETERLDKRINGIVDSLHYVHIMLKEQK